MVWIQIRIDIVSVLIWVQTVYKGFQQMIKVTASKERVKEPISNATKKHITIFSKLSPKIRLDVLLIVKKYQALFVLLKIQQNKKISSAANSRQCFMDRRQKSTRPLIITSEILKGQVILPQFEKNYLRKSYYTLLLYVLYCIPFKRTSACVCSASESCKSLALQDKCNI